MAEARPRIHLPPSDEVERALSLAAALALFALLVGTAWAWRSLPMVIPIHFGFSGEADSWAERPFVLLLSLIGAALYALLTVLARVPHLYNYPWSITPENAARQYLLARRLVLALRVVIVFTFLGLLAGTTWVALGGGRGLGAWFLPAVLSCLGLTLGWYFVRAHHAR